MTKRLKPADVGYSGKGVPDPATLSRLQSAYAKKVIRSGSLPPEIFDVYVRMNMSMGTGFRPPREGMELAKRLLPYLYFDVDDVDWE
jgi:hypothetical protein